MDFILTEAYVKQVLTKEIIIIDTDGRKLAYSPLTEEFRLYVRGSLSIITFSIDTAVDCYKNLQITEYKDTLTIATYDNNEQNKHLLIQTALSFKEKDYLVIYISDNSITVESVYRRLPDKDSFNMRLKLNREKMDKSSVNVIK